MMFRGTGTALVTPFTKSGIDYHNLGRLIDWQIDQKVEFLVVLGTTGESPAVPAEERTEIVRFAVAQAKGRVPVVVGTGGNNTPHAAESSREAEELGADGVLVVTPYYNKPSQEGLFRHFKTVAGSVKIPMILYNVPGRTGVNLLPDTVVRLAEVQNIVALKEASGSQAQVDETIRKVRRVRGDFSILSGNDDQAFHLVNAGGHGLVSVLSNIAPKETSDMVRAALAGRVVEARELHLKLFPLMKNLFMETSPMPVKYGVSRLGYCKNILRLPLVEASENCMAQINGDMKECLGV
ncbi:MAG: 4-hydroxy-tetrahydrodipicolinate synthase [Synergistaceae bacterium]|jgi:4-hydroxy-tetrahydrodipicolinate synthase|nr:4-hydroxy-tetrahydrodipicolinate synthase [Synergistaceae bacterium]